MGLQRFSPVGSGRMGVHHTISTIGGAAFVEYGCMGHMNYAGRDYADRLSGGCAVYSTHLTETDVALGDTGRLHRAVEYIVSHKNPEVIFLTPSSVPEITGIDLDAEARELSDIFPDTRIISLHSGGYGASTCRGVEITLEKLARTIPEDLSASPEKTKKLSFNIIGSCYDMFGYKADAEEIIRLMRGCFGAETLCVFSSGANIEDIKHMGGANINLVVRREGLIAALALQRRFGTPLYFGRPYGIAGTIAWLHGVAKTLGISVYEQFLERESVLANAAVSASIMPLPNRREYFICAHTDVVEGIAVFLKDELGLAVAESCCDDPYCQTERVSFFDEKKIIEFLRRDNITAVASAELIEFSQKPGVIVAGDAGGPGFTPPSLPLTGFYGAVNIAEMLAGKNISAETKKHHHERHERHK